MAAKKKASKSKGRSKAVPAKKSASKAKVAKRPTRHVRKARGGGGPVTLGGIEFIDQTGHGPGASKGMVLFFDASSNLITAAALKTDEGGDGGGYPCQRVACPSSAVSMVACVLYNADMGSTNPPQDPDLGLSNSAFAWTPLSSADGPGFLTITLSGSGPRQAISLALSPAS